MGSVTLLEGEERGLGARTEFSYDLDYAQEFAEREDWRAVSCHLPVGFEPVTFNSWPPFLLDLFPQGAALRYVVEHYRIADRPENYWKIIKTARLNPPGNVRCVLEEPVSAAARALAHRGFTREEVVAKGPDFLKYMVEQGAPVAGTTGAGGAAPKFLLREDKKGRFHADGALADGETKHCWLVKFPRGRKQVDEEILQAEQAYLEVARALGFKVQGTSAWEPDCLFVPRFDREVKGKAISYLGLESFYSLVGLPEFGSRLEHETYVQAIARFSDDPAADAVEYVLRDFLNVMLGNTDNHGRNSSLLKGEGWRRLAPLYDVAPMRFDPEGIVRNTSWGKPTAGGSLAGIKDFLARTAEVPPKRFDEVCGAFLKKTTDLEAIMLKHGVSRKIVELTRDERNGALHELGTFVGVGRGRKK